MVSRHYILVCRNNSLTISFRASGIGLVPITSLVCARIFTCEENDSSFQQSSPAAPRCCSNSSSVGRPEPEPGRAVASGRRLRHSLSVIRIRPSPVTAGPLAVMATNPSVTSLAR